MQFRKIVAVGIGNAAEFYDFLTFSFFAIGAATMLTLRESAPCRDRR